MYGAPQGQPVAPRYAEAPPTGNPPSQQSVVAPTRAAEREADKKKQQQQQGGEGQGRAGVGVAAAGGAAVVGGAALAGGAYYAHQNGTTGDMANAQNQQGFAQGVNAGMNDAGAPKGGAIGGVGMHNGGGGDLGDLSGGGVNGVDIDDAALIMEELGDEMMNLGGDAGGFMMNMME